MNISLYLITFLLLCSSTQLFGMEEITAQLITFKNKKEQKPIPLTKKELKILKQQSTTINDFLEDFTNNDTSNEPVKIYLPAISRKRIKRLLSLFQQSGELDRNESLKKMSSDNLIKSIMGLNYLNAPELLNLSIEFFVNEANNTIGPESIILTKKNIKRLNTLAPNAALEIKQKLFPTKMQYIFYRTLLKNASSPITSATSIEKKYLKKIIDCAINQAGDTIAYIGTDKNKKFVCTLESHSTGKNTVHKNLDSAESVLFLPYKGKDYAIIGTTKGFSVVNFDTISKSNKLESMKALCVNRHHEKSLFSLHGNNKLIISKIIDSSDSKNSIVSKELSLTDTAFNLTISPDGTKMLLLLTNEVVIASISDLENQCYIPQKVVSFKRPSPEVATNIEFINDKTIEITYSLVHTEALFTIRYSLNDTSNYTSELKELSQIITPPSHSEDKRLRAYGNKQGTLALELCQPESTKQLYMDVNQWNYRDLNPNQEEKEAIFKLKKTKNYENKAVKKIVIAPDNKQLVVVYENGIASTLDISLFAQVLNYINYKQKLGDTLLLRRAFSDAIDYKKRINSFDQLINIVDTPEKKEMLKKILKEFLKN